MKDPNGFRTFAIKYFHSDIPESAFIGEIETLVKLNHPCILRIFGYVLPSKTSQAEIHMEWASNGSLSRAYRIIKTPQCPSFLKPTGLSIIICGIVLGMRFMHSRGFIHQDLKPSNILINSQGRVVIGYFGSSRNVNADITPIPAGTLQYAAPELGEEVEWTLKVDVYSFGLILYELLIGSVVFREGDFPFDILRRKRAGYIPEFGIEVFPWIEDLIRGCLELDPGVRPSFDDILHIFERENFKIVSGAEQGTVSEYVSGILDWESAHPYKSVFGDHDCSSVMKRK
jgi:serine/threonine-protein kinase